MLTLRAWIVVLILGTIVRMDSVERAVWLSAWKSSAPRLARLNFAQMGCARLLFILWPLYVAVDRGWYRRAWHEGLLLEYTVALSAPSRVDVCLSLTKRFWNNLFVEFHVPTPTLYGVVLDGRLQSAAVPAGHDTIVLVKPDDDCCGRRIYTTPWSHLLQHPPHFDAVVQEYIPNVGSHIRLVTLRSKNAPAKPLSAYAVVADSKRVVSNQGQPFRVDVRDLGPIVSKLVDVHTRRFDFPAVGWDLLPRDGGFVVLEGNIPGAICWKHSCADVLTEYHRSAKTWLF